MPAILKRLLDSPLDFRTRDYATALDALAFLARRKSCQEAGAEVRDFLTRQLTSPREEFRTAAAKALGTLRDPRALAVLQPMITGGGPFADPVREAAAKSVQTLEGELGGSAELKNLWDQVQQLQKKTETLQKQLDDSNKKAEPKKK